MSRAEKKYAPPAAASGRTLLGRIRTILREKPVTERAELRARLRAQGIIDEYAWGGRKVFHHIHYLRRRGEIITTPTHITAVAVLPAKKRPPRKSKLQEGMRSRRIRLAAQRARKVAKLAAARGRDAGQK